MLVLSMDPGTLCTGYTISDSETREIIKCGKFQFNPKWKQSKRLAELFCCTETIIDEYNPQILVVEDQFVGKNKRTSLVTARAKGTIITVAGIKDIEVIEYSPTEVKEATTGKGNATKDFVANCVKSIYNNSDIVKSLGDFCDKGKNKNDDIFDALALDNTYYTLGVEKTIIKSNKKTKKDETKIISRSI